MINSEYEEFIYTISLLYHWFNNQGKILEFYKNNDPNIKLVKTINEASNKLMLNSHFGNNLKYRPMVLFSDEINLFLDIVVKNSYFSLKPTTKIEKVRLSKILFYKESSFYGWQNWYPYLKNSNQTKQFVESINTINNLIKESVKND